MSETTIQDTDRGNGFAIPDVFDVLRCEPHVSRLADGLPMQTLRHEVPDVFAALLAHSHLVDQFRRKPAMPFPKAESRTLERTVLVYSTTTLTQPILDKLEASLKVWRRYASQSGKPQAHLLQKAVVYVRRNTMGQQPA